MMLGVSAGIMGGDGATAAARETHENGGASGGSSEIGGPSSLIIPGGGVIDESDRSGGGGNRWPRQETLALLKIRSDMDAVFKDANHKGPLWDEVSRKMGLLGFQRNPKKCKEKFENVYKYHKRTKDGRSSKPDAKSYRFFDQLEALEAAAAPNPFTATPPPPASAAAPPPNLQIPSNVTVSSSTSPTPLSIVPPIPPKTANISVPINSSSPFQQQQQQQPHQMTTTTFQAHVRPSGSTSSSSTSSDEDIQRRRGRKRKWKDYFERLMRDVLQKQEELHSKFLDVLERRERDRTAREEAWRAQEAARIDRERNLLVHERSMSATKDKAVTAFLQKVSKEHNLQIPIVAAHQTPPPVALPTVPPLAATKTTTTPTKTLEISSNNNLMNNSDGFVQARSSSRWPKAEIEALIKLRTSLDIKYQENGPKGPLWEEISAAMAKIGYSRSPKRCKEKWENINKYYKKVKESNRKRPEDSKTCPYFQLLEEIYKEKAVHNLSGPFGNHGYGMKPENPGAPIMARPEQQWPVSEQRQHQDSLMNDDEVSDQNNDDEDDDDDDEDEEGVAGYEIITNKPPQQPAASLANTVE